VETSTTEYGDNGVHGAVRGAVRGGFDRGGLAESTASSGLPAVAEAAPPPKRQRTMLRCESRVLRNVLRLLMPALHDCRTVKCVYLPAATSSRPPCVPAFLARALSLRVTVAPE